VKKNIPEKYQPYIESIKKHNKEFNYILWDDQSLVINVMMYI